MRRIILAYPWRCESTAGGTVNLLVELTLQDLRACSPWEVVPGSSLRGALAASETQWQSIEYAIVPTVGAERSCEPSIDVVILCRSDCRVGLSIGGAVQIPK